MCLDILEDWILINFIEHVKMKRIILKLPEDAPAILWIDNHSSRNNSVIQKSLRDNHIEMISFVPHTTHCAQPIDRRITGPFKNKLESKMLFADNKNTKG